MSDDPLYDPLSPSPHDESEAVWDELSHQQSREIQQHHRRVSSGVTHGATRLNDVATTASSAIRSVVQQTASSLSSAAATIFDGHARTERKRSRRPRRFSSDLESTNGDEALAEFGLHSTPSSEALNEEVHHRQVHGPLPTPASAPSYPLEVDRAEGKAAPLLLNDHHEGGSANVPALNGNSADHTGSRRQDEGNFVFLRRFRLLPKRDGWGAVKNLDLFFTSIYNYYYHRGLMPIVGKGIVEIATLIFTLWLSVFLFAYVDWRGLVRCTDESTCHEDFQSYLIEKPFSTASFWNFLVILYCILFTGYGIFAVFGFFASVRDAIEAKAFFENKLGINAQKLEGGAVEWGDIVGKIIAMQKSGQYRVAIHGQDIDALVVAQRILRRENFMVAFFNRDMLDLCVPFGKGRRSKLRFFSKSIEWSIYFCILSYMFNHKYQVRPTFFLDPSSLKRRLRLCGVFHVVFMPFLLFFMTLHFFLLNMYDWRSSKQYLGPREWSRIAQWTFREFNELPHVFELRLGPSYEAADNYLKLFAQKSALVTSFGRILVFTSGSLAAVLIVLAAINDAILLHVKLGQWNLLWYAGVLGVTFTFGKGMLPDKTLLPSNTRNLFAEMDEALAKVSSHTHHYPDIWRGRGWNKQIQQNFAVMFQFKAQHFAMELLSTALAPFVLCISLPNCADDLCHFVHKVKMEVPGAGDVCGYSSFDFDSFQDEDWDGKNLRGNNDTNEAGGGIGSARRLNPEAAMKLKHRPKTRLGKMEKSFFNFKAEHPNWECSSSGQNLIDRVESYQYKQAIAFARERQHHVEAAARQLETLRRIENRSGRPMNSHNTGLSRLYETYVGTKEDHAIETAGADSGGGGAAETVARRSPLSMIPEAPSSPPEHHVHFQGADCSQLSFVSGMSHPISDDFQAAVESSTPHISHSSRPADMVSAMSVMHYADAGLSMELRRILNRSTLDPEVGSVLGATFGPSVPSLSVLDTATARGSPVMSDETATRERVAERQYMWLDRYHSHLEGQRQMPEAPNDSEAENQSAESTREDIDASLDVPIT